jgi:NCAIR mutase (PurE)-related protein
MTSNKWLEDFLGRVARGELDADTARDRLIETFRASPFEDLGFARVDHHRHLRTGFPEVVLGSGKSAEQIVAILNELKKGGGNLLATRVDADKAQLVLRGVSGARYEEMARAIVVEQQAIPDTGRGTILVVSAGTSDLAVAEEAVLTARLFGNRVERIHDVGVAGLHRLLPKRQTLEEAAVIIVVAGMEGALPSVVKGMVSRPVIAVPTSVGYGASFGGLAALLAMLNSCASGVVVVNIDNGFGAGYAASLFNRK